MRLALIWGCSLARLNEELGSDELPLWRAFQSLYDLPDGFNVVARLGPIMAGLAGAKVAVDELCPYFSAPRRARSDGVHPSLRRFVAMVGRHLQSSKA